MSEPKVQIQESQPAKQEGNKGEEEEVTEAEYIKKIDEKLAVLRKQKSEELCIYKVPSKLRNVKRDAYDPRVVSIGPFHQHNLNLVAVKKEHKWRYTLSFLQQTKYCLEACMNVVYDLEETVRHCYDAKIKYKKNELAEIMLIDGCFVLELFLRSDKDLEYKGKDETDPILKSQWMITALRQDLALLENQIPFFILQKLYETVRPHMIDKECPTPNSVATLALKFFKPPSQKSVPKKVPATNYKHLLDLLHKFYFLQDEPAGDSPINIMEPDHHQESIHNRWGFDHCASKLLDHGVGFKSGSSVEDPLLKITYSKGVIRIPQLSVDETTSSLLRNLIAYEQCSFSGLHGVTSYAFLMKNLISSSKDSELLEENEIIKLNRIKHRDYLKELKTILDEVFLKDDYFYDKNVCDPVNAYCKTWFNCHKFKVYLKLRFQRDVKDFYRTYFSTSWSFISFLAACFLLVLTLLQTYYTMNPK